MVNSVRRYVVRGLLLLCALLVASDAWAGPVPSQWVGLTDANGSSVNLSVGLPVTLSGNAQADPCLNVTNSPASLPISVSATGATLLTTSPSNVQTFVCSAGITVTGTSPTVQLEYGTQTTNPCDTGTTVLTGALAPGTTGEYLLLTGPRTLFTVPLSKQLCINVTGTSPSVQGYLSYVRQ